MWIQSKTQTQIKRAPCGMHDIAPPEQDNVCWHTAATAQEQPEAVTKSFRHPPSLKKASDPMMRSCHEGDIMGQRGST